MPGLRQKLGSNSGPDPAAEANHRVANSLALLCGLVGMQARVVGSGATSFTHSEVQVMLHGIAARVAVLGRLHRLLARAPSDGAVALDAYLRDIGEDLMAVFSSEERPLMIECSGSECLTPAKQVRPIALILCEILTNAMKYAHPSGVSVRITLICEALGDGALQVTVSDDGIGLPENFDWEKGGGLGLQIIRALTAELGAKLDVFSDNLGSTFRLRVPRAPVANAQTA